MEKPVSYSTCLNGTMSNVPLFAFVKANIYTFPRYLSETFDHLLYILKPRMLIKPEPRKGKKLNKFSRWQGIQYWYMMIKPNGHQDDQAHRNYFQKCTIKRSRALSHAPFIITIIIKEKKKREEEIMTYIFMHPNKCVCLCVIAIFMKPLS